MPSQDKNRHSLFFLEEDRKDKCVKSDQMIDRASLAPKSTLNMRKEIVGLKIQNKSVVDHTLHGLADTTSN